MKITIKAGDTVIEYEEDTVPLKNDSVYKNSTTLNLIKGLVDKAIDIDRNRYEEGE